MLPTFWLTAAKVTTDLTVASMQAMSATHTPSAPTPDPRDPNRNVWDGPPTEPYPLCSYDSGVGTVIYDPNDPFAWIEIARYEPARQEYI